MGLDNIDNYFNNLVKESKNDNKVEAAKDMENRFFTPEEYFQNKETDKENLPETIFKDVSPEEIQKLRDTYVPKKANEIEPELF